MTRMKISTIIILSTMKFSLLTAAALLSSASGFGLTSHAKTRSTSLNMVWGDKDYLIAPSILSADFARLGEEVDNVLEAGADVVHFDVMDNHYVPNLTIGPMVCKALRDHGVTAPIDVHLMVSPVDAVIGDFIDAGASYITFHPEATGHIDRSLQLIKNGGCKAGLVFNPATDLSCTKFVLDKLDIILLMSVNPGFGGQAFIPAVLDKAREARKIIDDAGIDCRLEIDGGVKVDNIKEVAEAGVDMMVAGSAILKEPRTVEAYKETIDQMRAELAKVGAEELVEA
jgi:ribulose-phosphate 3-epimerase